MEQWNSGTVWGNGGTVIVDSVVEQWNSDGRTVLVERCGGTVWWKSGTVLWNSGTVMVEHWNSDSGSVWWNTGTVMVEQCAGTVMVKQRGGTVEQ